VKTHAASRGNTDGDAVVRPPEDKVLIAGDLPAPWTLQTKKLWLLALRIAQSVS